MKGVVIDTKLFSRRKLDPASKKIEQKKVAEIEAKLEEDLDALRDLFWKDWKRLLVARP